MDPLTAVVGATAVVGMATAWRMRARATKAEAEVARLRGELHAERHAASHDALTGLPNRRAFYQLGALLVADPTRHPLVAVVLDLDDFKEINDRFGHAAGDQVLGAAAQRFARCSGDNLVARLGGDEFAGLLSSPTLDGWWLDDTRNRLMDAVAVPMQVAGRGVRVTASVGLAPVRGSHLAEALCQADAAMYHAKGLDQGGKRRLSSRNDGLQCQVDGHPAGRPFGAIAGRAAQATPSSEPSRPFSPGEFIHSAHGAEV